MEEVIEATCFPETNCVVKISCTNDEKETGAFLMLKPWSQRVIPTNYWTAEEGKQLSQLHMQKLIPQGIFETMRGMPLSRVM